MELTERLRRGLAGVVGLIVAAILFVLILLVAHHNSERAAALESERRSYSVLLLVRGLNSSLGQAEAALGRYVISGSPDVGTLYYDHWKAAGRTITRLESLTRQHPQQAALMTRLRLAYDRRNEELSAPATRAFYKQGWAALSLFNKAGSSPTLSEMASIITQLEKIERVRLDESVNYASLRADAAAWWWRLLSGMWLLVGLSALLFGWFAVIALQQRRTARQAAAAEAERAALLEEAIEERTGELQRVNAQLREEVATRSAAEAQLRQIQKMEAVGQLTGGIAHDFNNMLAVVVGGLELARRRVGVSDVEAIRHIEHAMEGANRAASLTRRLLSLARQEPLRPEAFCPARLLAGMSNLLDRTLGERIAVQTIGLEGDWLVWADAHQFENAILNLAVNARDAMANGGLLRIEADQIRLGKNAIGSLPAADYVRITVSDTGCGIERTVLDRVFEPFFTTKPVGKGTGLGLSQVFSFVRQSGGEVTIDSTPGAGTRVSIYMPRRMVMKSLPAAADDNPQAAEPEVEPLGRSGGIVTLVVEDDPRVRGATVAALSELGYDPIPCSGGDEALEILATRRDVELLISDVIMPGMTGPELVARVTQDYPWIGVLFVTGYAGEAAGNNAYAGHAILRKPFTISALAGALQRLQEDDLSEPHPLGGDAVAG